jgi:hypothetical protein
MSMHVFRKKRLGFNAIELVVVVLVVFILLGMVAVVLRSQQGADRTPNGRTQTRNNLKQLSLACWSVNDIFKRFPPAFDKFGEMSFPASVHVHLLPYIEQDNLYKTYLGQKGIGKWERFTVQPFVVPPHEDFTQTNHGAGIQNFAANLRVFSDKGMATQFDANMPALAAIEPGKARLGLISDGTSNTILFTIKYANCQDGGSRFVAAPDSSFAAFFGENAATITASPSDPRSTFQSRPNAHQCLTTPLMAQSMSHKGLAVGMADGHVRMVSPDISPRTWNLAVQPNDGMQLGDDWGE